MSEYFSIQSCRDKWRGQVRHGERSMYTNTLPSPRDAAVAADKYVWLCGMLQC